MKPTYTIAIRLNQEDAAKLEKLKNKGHKTVEILRAGIKALLAREN